MYVQRSRHLRAVESAFHRIRLKTARGRLRIGDSKEGLRVAATAGMHAALDADFVVDALQHRHGQIDVPARPVTRVRQRLVQRDADGRRTEQMRPDLHGQHHRTGNPAHALQVVGAGQIGAIAIGAAEVVAQRRRCEHAVSKGALVAEAVHRAQKDAVAELGGNQRRDERTVVAAALIARRHAAGQRKHIEILGVGHRRAGQAKQRNTQISEAFAHDQDFFWDGSRSLGTLPRHVCPEVGGMCAQLCSSVRECSRRIPHACARIESVPDTTPC